MTEELQRCSRCKCDKLLINFKMRENTEQFLPVLSSKQNI